VRDDSGAGHQIRPQDGTVRYLTDPPGRGKARHMNDPNDTDVTGLLDPDFEPLLNPDAQFQVDAELLATIRSTEPMPGVVSDVVERSEHLISPERGVTVRVSRPRGVSEPVPCVFSMHGGGYIMGWSTMYDQLFESWCPSLGLVGVSVDYRLAPETPYPGPLDDCYDALQWTVDHAAELGIDPNRLGLFGVSAGGGLAASLALLVRDRGELPLGFQMLESPMLDDRQQTRSSNLEGLPIWSKEANEFGWRSYLGPLYGSPEVPIYASPARAEDLAGLPPTYISTAERWRRDGAPRLPGSATRIPALQRLLCRSQGQTGRRRMALEDVEQALVAPTSRPPRDGHCHDVSATRAVRIRSASG
jgi:acetyl esterase/lipase